MIGLTLTGNPHQSSVNLIKPFTMGQVSGSFILTIYMHTYQQMGQNTGSDTPRASRGPKKGWRLASKGDGTNDLHI